MDELLLVITPVEGDDPADNGLSWYAAIAKIADRIEIMKNLSIAEQLELEQFKYQYC